MSGSAQSLSALFMQNPELAIALRRREEAQPLLRAGTSTEPVASPWQGVARLAQALLGGYESRKADEASTELISRDRAANDQRAKQLAALMGGAPLPGEQGAGQPAAQPMPQGAPQGPTSLAPDTTTRAQDMIERLKARGIPPMEAIALVGNGIQESGARTNPGRGDGGQSVGFMQWNGPRRENFRKMFGVEPDQATPDQTADFIKWELTGPEKAAWDRIQAAQTLGAKAAAVSTYYLRPRDTAAEEPRRAGIAMQLAGQTGAPSIATTASGADADALERRAALIKGLGAGDPSAQAHAALLEARAKQIREQQNYVRGRTDTVADRQAAWAREDANRIPPTLQVAGPDGRPQIVQQTPTGTGAVIGTPPQPPLGGEQQRVATALTGKVLAGNATPAELEQLRIALDLKTKGQFNPATGAFEPGGNFTPDEQRAADILRRTNPYVSPGQAAASASGAVAPPVSANPMAQPPVQDTTNTGSVRTSTAPSITPQAREDYRKAEVETARVLEAARSFYDKMQDMSGIFGKGTNIKSYLADSGDPQAVALNAAHDRLQEALRGENFLNTGVLQPAEMKLLTERLLDPRSLRGLRAGPEAYMKLFQELENTLHSGRVRKATLAGLPPPEHTGVFTPRGVPLPGGAGTATPLSVPQGWGVQVR